MKQPRSRLLYSLSRPSEFRENSVANRSISVGNRRPAFGTMHHRCIMKLDSLVQDIRISLRLLWKDKAFSVLAVLVLACGIGGVTTQFAVVNAVALRGLSFP